MINIPSVQECSHLRAFGAGVFKVTGISGIDFLFPSSQENELEDDGGEGRKTPESSPGDSYTSSSEVLTKKASATWTSSTERGRLDLAHCNGDCCIPQ